MAVTLSEKTATQPRTDANVRRLSRSLARSRDALRESALKTALCAAVVAAIPLGCFLRWATPSFSTNDDVLMLKIASGTLSGTPSDHLVFTNVLIGRALVAAFANAPHVNWYGLYLYAAHYLGTTAILYALLRRSLSWQSFVAFAGLWFVFELRLLLLIQFTSTAGVVAAGGLVLLLGEEERGRRLGVLRGLCGAALLVLAAMIREEAFFLAMLVAGPFFLYVAKRPDSKRRALAVLVAIGGCASVILYDHSIYQQDPAWQEYREYNLARGRVLDFAPMTQIASPQIIAAGAAVEFDPEMTPEEQEQYLNEAYQNAREAGLGTFHYELKWSDNDAMMFAHSFLIDPELYSRKNLERIIAEFGSVGRPFSDVIHVILNHLNLMKFYFGVTIINAAFLLLWCEGSRKRLLKLLFAESALLILLYGYLATYAKIEIRVTMVALWVINALLFTTVPERAIRMMNATLQPARLFGGRRRLHLAFSAETESYTFPAGDGTHRVTRGFDISDRHLGYAALFVIIAPLVVACGFTAYRLNAANRIDNQEYDRLLQRIAMDYMRDTPDAVFVVRGWSIPHEWFSPLADPQFLAEIPIIQLGWPVYSPLFNESLRKHGVTDLKRDLFENPNVFLICENSARALYARYVQEHFGEKLAFDKETNYEFPNSSRTHHVCVTVVKPIIAPSPD